MSMHNNINEITKIITIRLSGISCNCHLLECDQNYVLIDTGTKKNRAALIKILHEYGCTTNMIYPRTRLKYNIFHRTLNRTDINPQLPQIFGIAASLTSGCLCLNHDFTADEIRNSFGHQV